METRSASDVAQLPQNSKQFPEKHSCEREKSSPFHIRMWHRLTVERPHFVRPLADFCSLVNLAVALLNHDRGECGLLLRQDRAGAGRTPGIVR